MLLQPEKKGQISRPNEVRSSWQQGEGHENAISSTSQMNLSDFFAQKDLNLMKLAGFVCSLFVVVVVFGKRCHEKLKCCC